MPYKDTQKNKAYHARYMKEVWYPKNRKKHIGYVKNLKLRIYKFIDDYKRNRACADCGFAGKNFPQVLEFDHRRDKKFEIGSWSKSVLSLIRVRLEMQKCDLVCANCHRMRTIRRRHKS